MELAVCSPDRIHARPIGSRIAPVLSLEQSIVSVQTGVPLAIYHQEPRK